MASSPQLLSLRTRSVTSCDECVSEDPGVEVSLSHVLSVALSSVSFWVVWTVLAPPLLRSSVSIRFRFSQWSRTATSCGCLRAYLSFAAFRFKRACLRGCRRSQISVIRAGHLISSVQNIKVLSPFLFVLGLLSGVLSDCPCLSVAVDLLSKVLSEREERSLVYRFKSCLCLWPVSVPLELVPSFFLFVFDITNPCRQR